MPLAFSANKTIVGRLAVAFAVVAVAFSLCLCGASSAYAAIAPLDQEVSVKDVPAGYYATTVQSSSVMFKVFDNKEDVYDLVDSGNVRPTLDQYNGDVAAYNAACTAYVTKLKGILNGFKNDGRVDMYNVEKNVHVEVDENGNATLYFSITNGHDKIFVGTKAEAQAYGTREALEQSDKWLYKTGSSFIDYPSKADGYSYEMPIDTFNKVIYVCVYSRDDEPGNEKLENIKEFQIIVDCRTAALTVADVVPSGIDGDVANTLVNKSYYFLPSNATVADLLSGAGLTAGTRAESASNPTVFFTDDGEGGTGLFFLNKVRQPGYTWIGAVNGTRSQVVPSTTVTPGNAYQVIWDNNNDDWSFSYSAQVADPRGILTVEVESYEGDSVELKVFKRSELLAIAEANAADSSMPSYATTYRKMGTKYLVYYANSYVKIDQLLPSLNASVLSGDTLQWYTSDGVMVCARTRSDCSNGKFYQDAPGSYALGDTVPAVVALGYTTGSASTVSAAFATASSSSAKSFVSTIGMMGVLGDPSSTTGLEDGSYIIGRASSDNNPLTGIKVKQVKRVAVPTVGYLGYNGSEIVAVAETEDYTVEGGAATLPGDYTAILTLKSDDGVTRVWDTGSDGTVNVEYSICKQIVILPFAPTDLVYDGGQKVAFTDTYMYTVSGGAGVGAGTYTATFELVDPSLYQWSNTTAAATEVSWTIAKAAQKVTTTQVSMPATNYNGTLSRLVSGVKSASAAGAISFSKVSGASYFSLVPDPEKPGACKIKVAAKTPVGTYPVVIRVKAAETNNYKAGYKDVTVNVKVARFTPTITVTKKVTRAVNYSSTKAKTVACPLVTIQCASKPITYKLSSVKNAGGLTVTSMFSMDANTGAVTIAKGTPKGTYTLSVKISSDDNANYRGNYRYVSCVVKVV